MMMSATLPGVTFFIGHGSGLHLHLPCPVANQGALAAKTKVDLHQHHHHPQRALTNDKPDSSHQACQHGPPVPEQTRDSAPLSTPSEESCESETEIEFPCLDLISGQSTSRTKPVFVSMSCDLVNLGQREFSHLETAQLGREAQLHFAMAIEDAKSSVLQSVHSLVI